MAMFNPQLQSDASVHETVRLDGLKGIEGLRGIEEGNPQANRSI